MATQEVILHGKYRYKANGTNNKYVTMYLESDTDDIKVSPLSSTHSTLTQLITAMNDDIAARMLLPVYDSMYSLSVKNPVLAAGQIGIEFDTSKMKIGDNINPWDTLVYTDGSIRDDNKMKENCIFNTAALLANANTILAEGQLGIESDIGKIKIGDGVTPWNQKVYAGGSLIKGKPIYNTAAALQALNPVLAKGQLGIELDTNKIKVGDGVTAWNDLPYTTISDIESTLIYGTAALLAADNPVLALGQVGMESDTGKIKIGDGVTPWNGLPYSQINDITNPILAAIVRDTPIYNTAANFTALNLTLVEGQLAIETDTGKIKIGDGETDWENLSYLNLPNTVEMPIVTMTADEFNNNDPILEYGQIGIESDTGRVKVGDGVTPWSLLGYADICDVDYDNVSLEMESKNSNTSVDIINPDDDTVTNIMQREILAIDSEDDAADADIFFLVES